MSIRGAQLLRISRNVADLERSVAFYVHRLGFVQAPRMPVIDHELSSLLGLHGQALRIQRLLFGAQEIELVEVGKEVAAYPFDSTSADLWFQHFAMRVHDIESACVRLFRQDLPAPLPTAISHDQSGSAVPITLPPRSGDVIAFKFRDPDGHPLEFLQFPGDSLPRLQEGIDHSAISVADAERSIAFYKKVFGMRVAHRQLNVGIEQQYLDGMNHSTVEVIGLKPDVADGADTHPYIELLAYQRPTGRPRSESTMPLDIASDRLVFRVSEVGNIAESNDEHLQAHVTLGTRGNPQRILLRDPDGHFLEVQQ
jgi:catechol 2,3-dioxygenase-like lactoylglutathione lyase family enzyme